MKKPKESNINIGQSLTIDYIISLKQKIDRQFDNVGGLTLYSDELQSIDLTGIQLMQYFIFRAQSIGKNLHFNLKISKEQRIIVEKNGFSYLLETVFK